MCGHSGSPLCPGGSLCSIRARAHLTAGAPVAARASRNRPHPPPHPPRLTSAPLSPACEEGPVSKPTGGLLAPGHGWDPGPPSPSRCLCPPWAGGVLFLAFWGGGGAEGQRGAPARAASPLSGCPLCAGRGGSVGRQRGVPSRGCCPRGAQVGWQEVGSWWKGETPDIFSVRDPEPFPQQTLKGFLVGKCSRPSRGLCSPPHPPPCKLRCRRPTALIGKLRLEEKVVY